MWGPRQPTVIGRAWNRVHVKVEIMTAEAAKGAVVRGLVYCGMKRTDHMAVGGGGASIPRLGPRVGTAEIQGTGGRPMGHGVDGRLPAMGPPPYMVGMALRRPLVGACFKCRKTGHWKNECPDGGGVDARGCFTCGWKGHISRDCPRRVRMAMPAVGGSKDKDRMQQGPEERRMGPNEKGWVEKTKDIFDYTKSVDETIRGMRDAGGPSGARSYMGILKVAYMNVGRGCVAAHVFLESCARKEVDICFVGECWVARDGNCKSTVFYRTPAPIIVYYFPYITCLLYLLFLIKHVRTSG